MQNNNKELFIGLSLSKIHELSKVSITGITSLKNDKSVISLDGKCQE
nr:hypothetical protein [Mucilaginibacter sp. FT3.2]